MNELNKRSVSLVFKSAIGSILLGGMSMVFAASEPVALSGGEEVPPVTTSASGTVTIQVNPDKNVSGSVTTKGIDGTAAHIHEGEMGKKCFGGNYSDQGDRWKMDGAGRFKIYGRAI